MQEMFGDDAGNAKQALSEFVSRSVLCLAFTKPRSGNLRTGLYATLGGKHFVITAGHDLKDADPRGFTYQPRPPYAWRQPDDPRGGRVTDSGLPTPTAYVLDREPAEDPLDLMVLRIDPLPSRGGWVVPYDLTNCTVASTPFGLKTMLFGYPVDIGYEHFCERLKRNEYVLKPLRMLSHVVEEPHALKGYDPRFHFLINYKLNSGDPMEDKEAKGVSGAAVFVVPPKEQVIALPSEMLLGILHWEYTNIHMMRITRIEHVLPVVRKLLARCK